ncbi:MAG: 50S ribosomal protein L20 [Candidatus Spechtbacteria bacterium RIFCSPLOWO2_02_FULL_38_8]|uniref:Large ribosomal subunit protein bL20 n=1 Tax=Candidatus Spechtbacteria bacterium RIFCSPLOWO2_02_FULL_38_8 TaxID=1802164 RepID=A0A1G2HHP7_9BACT|nr:MAG: 50S ribosomal protein L20 [Candidatus Spechtbacteria bacterium RIFCSPLOWO2_02_FULL_38_8]
MSRVKRGKNRTKKRKKVLDRTRGFKWRRKSVYKIAKDATRHADARSFIGRKQKKRTMRQLWQIKINAGSRQNGMPYNQFINNLKKNKIELDRKILSDIAENNPEIFKKIIEKIK